MEGPGKEEDLCWGALLFGGADDGGYGLEVILPKHQISHQRKSITKLRTDTTPIIPYPPSSASFNIFTALFPSIFGYAISKYIRRKVYTKEFARDWKYNEGYWQ